jgi:hypothetical protein
VTDTPKLSADGRVVFDTQADFAAAYEAYLK